MSEQNLNRNIALAIVITIIGATCLTVFIVKHYEGHEINVGFTFEVPLIDGATHVKLDDKRIRLDGFQRFYHWADNESITIFFEDEKLYCKKTRIAHTFSDYCIFTLNIEYLKKHEYGFEKLDQLQLIRKLYLEND